MAYAKQMSDLLQLVTSNKNHNLNRVPELSVIFCLSDPQGRISARTEIINKKETLNFKFCKEFYSNKYPFVERDSVDEIFY